MTQTSFYIYILSSASAKVFYVGFSRDPHQRLKLHNTSDQNTFTSKFRPWELKAVFYVGTSKNEAMRLEALIKGQKSRKFIMQLIDPNFVPYDKFAQLVRVPHLRD